MMVRRPLTDKKIASYESRGFYSPEFREARRELMARKAAKAAKYQQRQGNFIKIDGRLVYSPT